jgi:quercetin dioxygenase-like cupin family protein
MMKQVDEKKVTPLEFPGRTLTVLFSPDNGSEHITTAISKVPAGGMLPWHSHETSEEIIYVLQGEGLALHESLFARSSDLSVIPWA